MIEINKFFDMAIDNFIGWQNKVAIGDCISSSNQYRVESAREYRTVFNTALILLNIAGIEDEKLRTIRKKLIAFLLCQKSRQWSFNYWVKNTDTEKQYCLPDDLDDTFVALAALQKNNYKFYPRDYAKITNLLVGCEDKEGGPYRTWLVSQIEDKRWLEVDVAVNANIAYFLNLNEIELPNLSRYFDRVIERNKLLSKYYPSVFSVIYFLSRFYRGKKRKKLINILLKEYLSVGRKKNCLDVALVVSALINLGYQGVIIKEGVEYLIDRYKKDDWNWQGFCLDPMIGREKYYNGSKVLTYSFCLQAVDQYIKAEIKEGDGENCCKKKELVDYCDGIFAKAAGRLDKIACGMRKDASGYLKEYQLKDRDGEIVLLPVFLAKGWRDKSDRELLEKLSLANLYGWMAYTIYDDFLDDEGEKKYLPVANLWFRELVTIYQTMPIRGLEKYFNDLLDEMEGANNWEINCCRFDKKVKLDLKNLPDFGNLGILASKSIGHSLSGVAILLHQRASEGVVEDFLFVFRNYLIARQLNDDAHDWEDDLKNGQINVVGNMVLEDWRRIAGNEFVNIETDLENLQMIFWNQTVKLVSSLIVEKADLAGDRIKKIESKIDLDVLKRKLSDLKGAARRAVKESREAREFIDEVGSK